MNAGVWLVIVAIVASVAISAWKKYNFSLIASVVCVLTFIVMVVSEPSDYLGIIDQLGFSPHDLTDSARFYTVLTSMYAHASLGHLFFNIVGLIWIGLLFEQRIGTRPYILLYFLSGLAGTMTFAAFRWVGPAVIAVGASGAIFGIMGGFARLYPRERFMLLFFPVPLPLWGIVVGYLLLQIFFLATTPDIAVEAHIGGLVAGMILAPLIVKQRPERSVAKRGIPVAGLRRLATTPALQAELKRIEEETVPDVRRAWIEHFISKAKCPQCGARLVIDKDSVRCERGHLV